MAGQITLQQCFTYSGYGETSADDPEGEKVVVVIIFQIWAYIVLRLQ